MDDSSLANAEFWLSWISTGKLVAAFLVAAGVVMEFGGDWISGPYEKIVKEAREKELATLKAETAAADARALEAQLTLEKYRAPRSISGAVRTNVIEALSPFAGVQFDMAVQQDAEPLQLRRELEDILSDAGWVQVDWRGSGFGYTDPDRPGAKQFGATAATGVYVIIDPTEIPQLGNAVIALVKALNDVGVDAAGEAKENKTGSKGAVHINVGRKA